MLTLRLTQHAESQPDHYRIEVELTGDGLPRQTATARFDFALSDQDQEGLRWYLEDFLQFPFDPAPKTAARIEERMVEIGTRLFRDVFHADDDARDLWATLRTRLNDTRVEIVAGVQEATAIPWELIRDPKTLPPPPRGRGAGGEGNSYPARHLPPPWAKGRALPVGRHPHRQGAGGRGAPGF
jgi:hypothetical protein